MFRVCFVSNLMADRNAMRTGVIAPIGEQVLERCEIGHLLSCELWGDLPDWLAPFEKIFRFAVW
jgi:hypothetical protein